MLRAPFSHSYEIDTGLRQNDARSSHVCLCWCFVAKRESRVLFILHLNSNTLVVRTPLTPIRVIRLIQQHQEQFPSLLISRFRNKCKNCRTKFSRLWFSHAYFNIVSCLVMSFMTSAYLEYWIWKFDLSLNSIKWGRTNHIFHFLARGGYITDWRHRL